MGSTKAVRHLCATIDNHKLENLVRNNSHNSSGTFTSQTVSGFPSSFLEDYKRGHLDFTTEYALSVIAFLPAPIEVFAEFNS